MNNKFMNIAIMPKYGYINRALSKISKLALVGYILRGAQSARAFFVRNISMRSHLNGEAGEGHLRMCRFSNEPVCQPFSALPPLFDSNRQSFYFTRSAFSCLKISIKLHANASSPQTLHTNRDYLSVFPQC